MPPAIYLFSHNQEICQESEFIGSEGNIKELSLLKKIGGMDQRISFCPQGWDYSYRLGICPMGREIQWGFGKEG
jgi:hypothetical protein